jgi:hypothetical protein
MASIANCRPVDGRTPRCVEHTRASAIICATDIFLTHACVGFGRVWGAGPSPNGSGVGDVPPNPAPLLASLLPSRPRACCGCCGGSCCREPQLREASGPVPRPAVRAPEGHREETSKLRLPQRARALDQSGHNRPDRCPEPERQDPYQDQMRPCLQSRIEDTGTWRRERIQLRWLFGNEAARRVGR